MYEREHREREVEETMLRTKRVDFARRICGVRSGRLTCDIPLRARQAEHLSAMSETERKNEEER